MEQTLKEFTEEETQMSKDHLSFLSIQTKKNFHLSKSQIYLDK